VPFFSALIAVTIARLSCTVCGHISDYHHIQPGSITIRSTEITIAGEREIKKKHPLILTL
jgi:hypothetical protein